jgi:hypothetical protein
MEHNLEPASSSNADKKRDGERENAFALPRKIEKTFVRLLLQIRVCFLNQYKHREFLQRWCMHT